ncbi:MAG: UxaA family hydrolase [Thermoanaerobacteraceae bacterium]|nr:UxaA family hydrolase [Thermoanaerobacteraceae bacterium]
MEEKTIIIDKRDNVATAMKDLQSGEVISIGGNDIVLLDNIPVYHKFAVRDIQEGGDVVKYGEVIGKAVRNIKAGEYVHVHNIVSQRGK